MLQTRRFNNGTLAMMRLKNKTRARVIRIRLKALKNSGNKVKSTPTVINLRTVKQMVKIMIIIMRFITRILIKTITKIVSG